MIGGFNRRAMMASGETSAAVAIARSAYAAMQRADESDDSFDSLYSDTVFERSLPALCEDDDDEEENDSVEEEDWTVYSGRVVINYATGLEQRCHC